MKESDSVAAFPFSSQSGRGAQALNEDAFATTHTSRKEGVTLREEMAQTRNPLFV
jgi:hypothetical protein